MQRSVRDLQGVRGVSAAQLVLTPTQLLRRQGTEGEEVPFNLVVLIGKGDVVGSTKRVRRARRDDCSERYG
jgi:hypothetical protein